MTSFTLDERKHLLLALIRGARHDFPHGAPDGLLAARFETAVAAAAADPELRGKLHRSSSAGVTITADQQGQLVWTERPAQHGGGG